MKITASTQEEFKKIEDLVNTLPNSLKDLIEHAFTNIISIECVVKNLCGTGSTPRVSLPIQDLVSIMDNGDNVKAIYSKMTITIPYKKDLNTLIYQFC